MGLTPSVLEVQDVLVFRARQVVVGPMVPVLATVDAETSAQGPRKAHDSSGVHRR